MKFQKFEMKHYEQAMALWKSTPGIGQSSADLPGNMKLFLKRNPGFSFVVINNAEVAGTILCGHDGRRGFIYHLCVGKEHRKRGLGRQLVELALNKLFQAGIEKCHIMVLEDNALGKEFWNSIGFNSRYDLSIMSKELRN